jgi:hypothetical protein
VRKWLGDCLRLLRTRSAHCATPFFFGCFLFPAPLIATPPLGAWAGTLGKHNIAACFDGSQASYYYASKGIDVALASLKNAT